MQLKRKIAAGLREPRTVPLKMPPNTLIYKPLGIVGTSIATVGLDGEPSCGKVA